MTWARRNVVVTGAGGFIGSHLVERLLALDAHVTAFVRYNSRSHPGFLDLLAPHTKHIRIVPGDIRDPEAVRSAMEGADTVFHLAPLCGAWRSPPPARFTAARFTCPSTRSIPNSRSRLIRPVKLRPTPLRSAFT